MLEHYVEIKSNLISKVFLLIIIFFSLPLELLISGNLRKLLVAFFSVLFLVYDKQRAIKKKNVVIGILVFFYVFYSSFPGVAGFSTWINFGYTSLFFFFLKDDEVLWAFEQLKNILAVVFLLGLISYTLVCLNLITPLYTIHNELRGSDYQVYPFFLLENLAYMHPLYAVSHMFRFNSIFDEPGVVGTYSALLLICKPLKCKNSFVDGVLFVAGLISFSLAFYVLMLSYFIFNLRLNKKSIIILFILVLFGLMFSNQLNEVIFNRVEFVDGKFSGDNRVAYNFEQEFEKFLKSDYILIGMGNAAHQNFPGSSTYLGIIYNYGFIGFIMYVGIFLLFCVQFHRLRTWIFFLIFMINIYQRPYSIDILTFVILYSGLLIYERSKKNDISNYTTL